MIEMLNTSLTHQKFVVCYLLVGTSSFLLQEARDTIWQGAKKQGFSDRQTWEVTKRLDFKQVRLKNSYFDLFHRSFIELRLATLNEAEGNQLHQLVKELSAPVSLGPVVVISCEKPLTNMQKSRWFQQIASMSTLIVCEPPAKHHFPQWIKHKFQKAGLQLEQEALSELVKCVEGNLLATVQIIKKLSLIYGRHKEPLTSKQLQLALTDEAIFELFHLTDAVLKGEADRCIRISKHLQATNAPPALVLGYLLKILRILAALRYGLDNERTLSTLFQKYAVWTKQQAGFTQAVKRLKAQDMPTLFGLAQQADRCIKGADSGNSWDSLQKIILYLVGYRIM